MADRHHHKLHVRAELMRIPIFIASAVALACGGPTDTGNDVVSVTVTPETSRLSSLSQAVQLTAAARNADGDNLPDRTFTWSSTDNSIATVSTTGEVTAVGDGAVTITAMVEGVSGTASITVDPVVAQIDVVSGADQTGEVGTVLPESLTVRAVDSLGNPFPGATVTWIVITGAGTTLGPAASSTNVDGTAATQWTLGTRRGRETVAATTRDGEVEVRIDAIASSGIPAAIEALAGDSQMGYAGETLPIQLRVRVLDRHGNPVGPVFGEGPIATVAWSATAGGGSISGGSPMVPDDGQVSAFWRLGRVASDQSAMLTVTGITSEPPWPPAQQLSVTFSATAGVGLAFERPEPNGLAGSNDSLQVVAIAQSVYQIASVEATVDDRTVSLQPVAFPPDRWLGSIPLGGLAPGPHDVVATATDLMGRSRQRSRTFRFDQPPRLEIIEPRTGTVARPGMQVTVICHDDIECTSVTASLGSSVLATGQSGLDQVVTLPGQPGPTTLTLRGVDGSGQSNVVRRSIYVETSPQLQEVVTVGGPILDVSPDSVLFVDDSSGVTTLRFLVRSAGATTVVSNENGKNYDEGFLTPAGAIFITNDRILRDWRNGTIVGVTQFGEGPGEFTVAGQYAIWHTLRAFASPAGLQRRDLTTGTNLTISGVGRQGDVAENGDVVYNDRDRDGTIYRFRGGISVQISQGTTDRYPVTDGTNIVYGSSPRSPVDITLFDGTVTSILSSLSLGFIPSPPSYYQTSGGWVGYVVASGGLHQVWTRDPAGQSRQVTIFGTSSTLDALGPNGEVSFISNGRRYAAVPDYTAPAREAGSDVGRSYWENGQLYVVVGRTVFAVQ